MNSDSHLFVEWHDSWLESEVPGCAILYLEVALDGRVVREVALDANGVVCHKCPSADHKYGTYGLFDLALIATEALTNDLSKAEFDALFANG